MKNCCVIAMLIYCSTQVCGQMAIQYTTTEVLDKYEKKFRHWGGDNETIRFLIVRKVMGSDTTIYAQCEVENKDWEKAGCSTNVAVGGSGGWAIGIGDFERVETSKGVIRFSSQDYGTLLNYLNQFHSLTKAGDPDFDKTWTATFNDRFSLSLTYVQARIAKWAYILSIDGANFETYSDESLELIKKMAGFRRWLKTE